MRLLVVSDVHGNWPALETVAAVPHDAVLCLGDTVGYGPQPGACLRWLRANGAHVVQGNHDRALADGVPPRCSPDFEWLAAAAAGIARAQLAEEEVEFLRALPRTLDLVLDGKRLRLLHAMPAEPLYGYLGPDPERWRAAVAGVSADILLVGHTHLPFHFEFEGLQVVNPGSLGQPKHGDPRAAYAILENGVPRLERAEYPIGRTIAELEATGIDASAREALSQLLRTGRTVDLRGRSAAVPAVAGIRASRPGARPAGPSGGLAEPAPSSAQHCAAPTRPPLPLRDSLPTSGTSGAGSPGAPPHPAPDARGPWRRNRRKGAS